MATYKEIKGVTLQTLDEDPVVNAGSWASGGNRPAGVQAGTGFGAGSTAGLAATGNLYPPNTITVDVQTYDGSSWTEIANVNTGRKYLGASGGSPYTAGIIFAGGLSPGPGTRYTNAEVWNGSAWTETGDLNTARDNIRGAGASSTAALAFGGGPQPAYTENWNGSAWTEVADLNTGRGNGAGFGTNTNAVAAGNDSSSGITELWDGSSWTEVADLNTGRAYAFGFGVYTDGIVCGGEPNPKAQTEAWDGSSWTEVADLGSARWAGNYQNGSSGQDGLISGGLPSATTATEEWTFPPVTQGKLKEGMLFLSGGTTLKGFGKAAGIPAATFASGGSLNTARGYHGGAGTDHEALLAFGGTTGTAVNNVEQYNGSSWSEVAEINTTRANLTGFGSSTAAIAGNGSTPTKVETESWNGSSWTEIAETNFPRSDSASAGTQTSGMIATGTPVPGNPSLRPGGSSIVTETWNGTSWTEVGDTNTQRLQAGMAGSGTTSASIIAAGEDGPGSRTLNAETWNGTSWTEVNNLSNQRGTLYNFMGNASLANAAGGYSGTARLATNEHWNGSSWTEINDLSTARNAAFGAGSAVNGAVFGGDTGDYQSATEEFIADNTLSTVTVS